MAINPSALQSVKNDGTGAGLDVTIIPPVGGTYNHTQVWYVKLQAPYPGKPPAPLTPWQDGGTYVGAPGVSGVHNIAGLDPGYYYELILQAFSAADGYSTPSLGGAAMVAADADPVVERVSADLAAVCEGISKANGYYIDVQEVHRVRRSGIITLGAYPAIVVQATDDDMTDGLPVEHITNKLNVVVEGWLKEGDTDNMDRYLNLFISDIERAVLADWRRSGNAITTKALRWTKYMSEEVAPYGAIQVYFMAHYRHQRGNPARQI